MLQCCCDFIRLFCTVTVRVEILNQTVTFMADIKAHGSINSGLHGYEVVRESEPGARGQKHGIYSQKACQLAWVPWSSPSSAIADKRKWDFHYLLVS